MTSKNASRRQKKQGASSQRNPQHKVATQAEKNEAAEKRQAAADRKAERKARSDEHKGRQ